MNAVILTKEEVTLLLACANKFRSLLLDGLAREIPEPMRDEYERHITTLASARRKLGIMEAAR